MFLEPQAVFYPVGNWVLPAGFILKGIGFIGRMDSDTLINIDDRLGVSGYKSAMRNHFFLDASVMCNLVSDHEVLCQLLTYPDMTSAHGSVIKLV